MIVHNVANPDLERAEGRQVRVKSVCVLSFMKPMCYCFLQTDTEAKIDCIEQVKLARFERFCNGDEPICPWMLLMNSTRPSRQPTDNDDDDGDVDDVDRPQPQQQTNFTSCCPFQGRYSNFLQPFSTVYRKRPNDEEICIVVKFVDSTVNQPAGINSRRAILLLKSIYLLKVSRS